MVVNCSSARTTDSIERDVDCTESASVRAAGPACRFTAGSAEPKTEPAGMTRFQSMPLENSLVSVTSTTESSTSTCARHSRTYWSRNPCSRLSCAAFPRAAMIPSSGRMLGSAPEIPCRNALSCAGSCCDDPVRDTVEELALLEGAAPVPVLDGPGAAAELPEDPFEIV